MSVTETSTRRLDWGRVVMVPFCSVLGLLALVRLVTLLLDGDDSAAGLLTAAVTTGLTALFYALIIWAYLRRGPSTATSRVTLALVAGPTATFLPFLLPYAGTGDASTGSVAAGNALLLVGFAWSVWSLRCLDRSLSVVPQARELVQHGPYSVVRHPLYLGELVAMLGLALTLGGVLPLLGWAALVLLQCYRAVQEEALLGAVLPGYASYQQRTARVVPGVF